MRQREIPGWTSKTTASMLLGDGYNETKTPVKGGLVRGGAPVCRGTEIRTRDPLLPKQVR